MKAKLLHASEGQRTYAIVFDKGDEVARGLREFASTNQIFGAQFSAIGAFSRVVLGYFDRELKQYRKIPIDEQVEVLSLVGNVANGNGKPKLHAHVVIGKADGTAHGGHLLEAHVWPTLEVVMFESPAHLQRISANGFSTASTASGSFVLALAVLTC